MSHPMSKTEKEAATKQNFLQLLRKCEFVNLDNDPDSIPKLFGDFIYGEDINRPWFCWMLREVAAGSKSDISTEAKKKALRVYECLIHAHGWKLLTRRTLQGQGHCTYLQIMVKRWSHR